MTRSAPELRTRLLRHVLIPLFITWALGTAAVISIAYYFAGKAFDRAILDDAFAIASHVDADDGIPRLRISQAEITSLLFDQTEQVYFAIFDTNGVLRAGHGGLREASQPIDSTPMYSNIYFHGKPLRTATIRSSAPVEFTVVVGLTTISRESLLQRLSLYSLLPQAVLLIMLAWWLRRAISRDVAPLNALQSSLHERDARDLSPIPSTASTSEVRKLTEAMNGLLARIQIGVDSQAEFVGNVAHELRTPLAGIRALANYALGQSTPDVWREKLQEILRSEDRASHMIDQLLALALANEADASMHLEPIHLNALVRDAVLRFLPRTDALKVDLGVQGLDAACYVLGHTALLEGILNNLVDNALRHGKNLQDQPSKVTIEVRTEGADQLLLLVSDNGPGVSAEQSTHLQTRWARGTPQFDMKNGAGLGLAIVGKYAELMQADFSLHAASPAPGLTAQLTLRRTTSSPSLPARVHDAS